MPIVVACSCGKKYQVGDDKAGMKLRCKACQAVIAVPTPKAAGVDEFDDFGLGDDFGAGDDFGDPAGQGEPIAPRPKTAGKKGSKSKGKAKGKAKAGGKKKSAKGKSEMSPAVKYSLAGGIVVVTIGIVLGILYARGVIGGGKKDAAPSGGDDPGSAMASGDLVGDPGGAGNPGAAPKVKQPVQPKKWTPRKEWTPDAALLGQLGEPQPLKDFPEYRIRVPKSLRPGLLPGVGPNTEMDGKVYAWREIASNTTQRAGLFVHIARTPSRTQLPADIERMTFRRMAEKPKKGSKKYSESEPNTGTINGITFQRSTFKATIDDGGRELNIVGFTYVGVDQDRTLLVAIVGADSSTKAFSSLPVMESAVLSFQRQGAMSEEPAPKRSPSAPQAIAAADLLKQNPVGSKTLEKKTIRVRGTVARPLDQAGWLHLTGDAQRTVACQFQPVPQPQPAVGQAVVVEGTFFQSRQQYVTLGRCKLVTQVQATTGNGRLGKPPNGEQPAASSKYPIVLSKANVRFAKNNWLIQVDYKFTRGAPAPNDWYFFTVTVPGNQPSYQPMQGSSLRKQGTLRLRTEATKGQPMSGEVSITVFQGESRNQSTGRPVAETLKVKVGESGGASKKSAATDIVPGRLIRSWKHNVATNDEKNAVTSLAFSPDGKALAAVGRDGMVKLWDPGSGRNIASWKGHTRFLNAVAFHPKGTFVASGGEDRLVKLWDVKSGRDVATLKGHDGAVTSVAFTRDGNTLVSCGGSSTLVWDVATKRKTRTIDAGALDNVRSLAVHSDGVTLATGGDGVRLWNLKTGKAIATLKIPATGPGGGVESVAFSPDSKLLAAGTATTQVFLWDGKTRKHLATLGTRRNDNVFEAISAIAFSPNGKRLASVPVNPVVGIWNVESRSKIGMLKSRSTQTCVAFSPDGKTVATGDTLNNIMLWDASKFGGK